MKKMNGRPGPEIVVSALLLLSLPMFGQGLKVPKELVIQKNPVAVSDTIISKAKADYAENCLQCHGPSGKGDGPMSGMLKDKPADLTDAKILADVTDGQIFWTVTQGKMPIMPAFESKLMETERWGLVHLLRTMSNTKPNNTPSKKP